MAIHVGTGMIPVIIQFIGIGLLILLPINHARDLEIQAAIEEKRGKKVQVVQ